MVQHLGFQDYRNSHRADGKGRAYDRRYATDLRDGLLWSLEQRVLSEFLQTHLEGRERHLLDFACGTGRLTSYLEDRVTTCVGVDVSTSMLDVARQKLERTELIQADLTRDNILKGRQFDLITAFRFFLNAEPVLRTEVIRVLAGLLGEDGYLIFNNHRNLTAPWFIVSRVRNRRNPRGPQFRYMSRQDMCRLAAGAGLEVVDIRHVGLVPSLFHRMVPQSWIGAIEERAMRHRALMPFSEELIALCRHR